MSHNIAYSSLLYILLNNNPYMCLNRTYCNFQHKTSCMYLGTLLCQCLYIFRCNYQRKSLCKCLYIFLYNLLCTILSTFCNNFGCSHLYSLV